MPPATAVSSSQDASRSNPPICRIVTLAGDATPLFLPWVDRSRNGKGKKKKPSPSFSRGLGPFSLPLGGGWDPAIHSSVRHRCSQILSVTRRNSDQTRNNAPSLVPRLWTPPVETQAHSRLLLSFENLIRWRGYSFLNTWNFQNGFESQVSLRSDIRYPRLDYSVIRKEGRGRKSFCISVLLSLILPLSSSSSLFRPGRELDRESPFGMENSRVIQFFNYFLFFKNKKILS